MNKKLTILLLALMCVGISACQKEGANEQSQVTDDAVQETLKEESYTTSVVLFDCDTNDNLTSSYGTNVTSKKDEYKVGTGAYRSIGAGSTRFRIALANTVDITSCKDGGLQFWLYIGDKSEFLSTSIKVELGSAGEYDKSELQWSYNLTKLKANGWNKVTLEFADALQTSGDTGPIDLSAVNFFRLYFSAKETNEDALLILDDVRAVGREEL